jgi:ABC-type transport system substrate-binding protein/DNA-binding SARP family transcriptional activator
MEFRLLGPVEVRLDGELLPVGGMKPRALLAMLLLGANEVVSRDRLVEGLWGGRRPASAEHGLDDYLSRLRRVLGADRIERRAPGYLLRVEPDELDLACFERLLVEGRNRLAASEPDAAVKAFDEALALWRGSALADLQDEPFATAAAWRLEERRLLCCEERIDALLARGGGADLVAELERLVVEHPFRERLLGQLMVALYRSGRQADALAAYQRGRGRLAAELGLEPSLPLRQLERQILDHDPALAGTSLAPTRRAVKRRRRRAASSRRGRVAFVAAAVGVAVVAAAAVIELGAGGTRTASAARSASTLVQLVGGAGSASSATVLPEAPAAAAVGDGSVWLAEPNLGEVVRVDEATRRIVETIPVGAGPGAIVYGGGAVWVASVPGGSVLRIDPATDRITRRIPLGTAQVGALAYGFGRLWIADTADNALLELDPATDTIAPAVQLYVQPTALAIGDGAVWVADYDRGTLTRVNPRTGATLFTKSVGDGPAQIAIGKNAVWVANSLDSTVARVDPATGDVYATAVGSDPVALAATSSAVWVASKIADDVTRLDPYRPSRDRTIPLNGQPTALAASGRQVWLGAEPDTIRRGGTIVLLFGSPVPIDPSMNLYVDPFQSADFNTDGLVTYNNTSGPAGAQFVPDLAIAIQPPTQGGTVYTFQLRPRIRYSDGRLVQASDFRRSVERLFRLDSPGIQYFSHIVGAAACTRRRCDLTQGVVTDDQARTVSFHLVAPDPDFLSKLTYGLVTPIPPGTPWHRMGWTPVPGTGPYEIASANNHEIRYVRNPYFHTWSHPQPDGIPDEIVMRFGLSPAQEVKAIEQGRADWTFDGVPASLLPTVETQYAADVHSWAQTTMAVLQFNTTVPPFNSLRARQALNDAIDRAAVVRFYGGPLEATATCQILMPGLIGYRPYCPYTRDPTGATGRWQAPNLAKARQLVAESGTRGDRITVWGSFNDASRGRALVPYVVSLLDRLGYRARAHLIPQSAWHLVPQRAYRKIQISASSVWTDVSPANFFDSWFTCNAPYDHHWFCNPSFDQAVRRAQTLQAEDSPAAATLWARLDRRLVDQAAAAPLVNPRQIDFVSAHVTNYQHNPVFGILADQLQPRQPTRASRR